NRQGVHHEIALKRPAGRVSPEQGGAEQEPVNISVQAADMERARADADEADYPGKTADDQAGKEDALAELQHEREALLNLGDVPVVEGVGGPLHESEETEERRGFFLKRVRRGRLVEHEGGTGANHEKHDAGDERLGA